jgi:hypothetical protein
MRLMKAETLRVFLFGLSELWVIQTYDAKLRYDVYNQLAFIWIYFLLDGSIEILMLRSA